MPSHGRRMRPVGTCRWDVGLNIRQLQYFHLVACTGSFSAAAKLERVSAQAVSKAIIELEDELGGPLFERGGRHVALTARGEALIGPAREAVASFDAVSRAAEGFDRRGTRPTLRLALVAPPFMKHGLICALLSQLLSRMVGMRTSFRLALGSDALADLRAGNLDAFFTIGGFDDPRCRCQQVGTVCAGAFVGKRHPLRSKRPLGFADLAAYPVLYNRQIDDFNVTMLTACRARGLASPVVEINTGEEVNEFLNRQNGYILGVYLKALDVGPFATMSPIDPADMPPVPICMVTLAGRCDDVTDCLDRFVREELPHMKRAFGA